MDRDFWSKINLSKVKTIFLCLPDYNKNMATIIQLKELNFKGDIAAIALYDDEIKALEEAGASAVYNFYAEAGIGFAEHVRQKLLLDGSESK